MPPVRSITEPQVRAALQQVRFPGYSRDIVSFGLLKSVRIGQDNSLSVLLEVTTNDPAVGPQIRRDCEAVLRALPAVGEVTVQVTTHPAAARSVALPAGSKIAGVQHIIAIASGKGGVGKSTVAVNLACALRQRGLRVGVLDADIHGPSIPRMLGTAQRPTLTDEKLDAVEQFGLKMMSMALLLEDATAVIWRGPMIAKAVQQLSLSVNWGELDLLVVDLPPGTGDAQLTLCQTLALDGGVIVTTPQEVALDVARRGIAMFQQVNVRILGLIENMSYYLCPQCGHREEIFGHDGGRQEAQRLGVPFLGAIPLYRDIRIAADRGQPVVVAAAQSDAAEAFRRCATRLAQQLGY